MLRIFRYFKGYAVEVTVIILLLIVQAFCDLSLPKYTSDIVDIGIQQGGIEHVAPERIRATTLENLKLFMTDEETSIVSGSYIKDDTGNYQLEELSGEAVDKLDGILGPAIVMLSTLKNSGEITIDGIKAMLDAGAVTKAQLLEARNSVVEKLGGESGTLVTQKAMLFVKEEYEQLGLDLGGIQTDYLLSTGAKMMGLTVLMALSAILVGLLASRTAAKIGMSLRANLFKKVVSFSSAEIDKFSTASLITRSTNDIQQVQMVTVMLLRMVIYAPILGAGGIIMVSGTNTGMGWIIGVAVGVIMLLVGVLVKLAMPKFKQMQQLVDRLNLISREILTGIPVIRAFSREKHEEKRFAGANENLAKTQLFTSRVMSFMMPAMMLVMNGITVLIVWSGTHGIELGNLQVGDMMAFITYTMQIVMSFLMLTMISVLLPRAGVAAARIDEVTGTEPSIRDAREVKDDSIAQWNGVVAFEDVSFRYPDAEENVLEHISFTAQPGQTTAIIGSTGSGKSTLIHLIPRFFDVTEGRITLDGVDIRDISQKKLRSLLGYVPQKGVLFSGDIESNLKFGGNGISDEAMREAAQIAQAEDFINDKPDGYLSPIAQGGSNVSGGQKQRLSIARAVAKGPKVFLFDDSFSALDYKTDVALRRALKTKTAGATVIIVAQRISTILHAEQIVVLDEGRIAGVGCHASLMQSCQTYREIAGSQLSANELEGGLKL